MDFQCDLYVYESSAGVEVDVASNRHVVDRSGLPPAVSVVDDEWLHRHWVLMKLLDSAVLVPIDLPHAGEWRTFDTLGEAADWIDFLETLGYVVPQGMTTDMRTAEVTP